MMPEIKNEYYYRDHPKECEPDDYWGQVKRTINGEPVTQEQIDIIIKAISDGLDISDNDTVLDLCCGNGALTTYLFAKCNGGLGVDFSKYLIDIAKSNFIKGPDQDYIVSDVVEFSKIYSDPERFTKCFCYGSFQYLPSDSAYMLLSTLRERFSSLQILYIGNVPDKNLSREFLGDDWSLEKVSSHATPIGIWRAQDEFKQLANDTGWDAEFVRLGNEYYASHYRYDVCLRPIVY